MSVVKVYFSFSAIETQSPSQVVLRSRFTSPNSWNYSVDIDINRLGSKPSGEGKMNALTKVFIVEHDTDSLVSLMLWLDQFPELDVSGSTVLNGNLAQQVEDAQPDVVLLGIPTVGLENLPTVRMIKSALSLPQVVLMHKGESVIEGTLASETDGQIGAKTSLKELCETIKRVANKRRLAVSAANIPMTKAG
jgi:hypothetical protein